jgi:hypothetical protein
MADTVRAAGEGSRFTGEALVTTGIEYLPKFPSVFDLSGYVEVLE